MAKRFTVPRAEAGGMSAQRIKPAVGTSAIRGDALPTPNIDVGRSSFSFVPAKTMTDLGDTLAGVLASADANDTALALQERKIRIQVGSQELQKDLITSSNEAFEEATKIGGPTSETAGRRNFDPSNIDKVAGEWEQRQIDAYYKKFKDDQVFIDNTQGDFFKSLELGKVNITKKLRDFVTNELSFKVTGFANDLVNDIKQGIVSGIQIKDDDQLKLSYSAQVDYFDKILKDTRIDAIEINGVKISTFEFKDYMDAQFEIYIGSKAAENKLIKPDGSATVYIDYAKLRKDIKVDDPKLKETIDTELFRLESQQEKLISSQNLSLIREFAANEITLDEAKSRAILYSTDTIKTFEDALETYADFINNEGGVDDYKLTSEKENVQIRKLLAREFIKDVVTPFALAGETKPKSIIERYLDKNDRTVGTRTFDYATKIFDGKLGNQKSFYKELDNKFEAIRKDPVLKDIITTIKGNKKTSKYLRNINELDIHFAQFMEELETKVENSIDGVTNLQERQKIVNDALNRANPSSILNQTINKYQMRREFFDGNDFKSPILRNVKKDKPVNNEIVYVRGQDGNANFGEGEVGTNNLKKMYQKYKDNNASKDRFINDLQKNSEEQYDKQYWIKRVEGLE